ncbi:DUF4351 domain-containing protein [Fimbriiglobus ruber]|uniref:DUF4351 domain-containing protein n=1 Tax=Fimbriiglobus ruber TaxID=1908690 RepID=A0A225E7G9_9BACT|nr:DUF4351 domain-containing protein [Fimbriiglobus ruber]OWK46728.1 hypothetical protein FRUB_00427 [Fimbriiglobus ruber]
MQKPYDATSKDLVESDPAGWVMYISKAPPAGPVRVIDADLATVSAEADKVIRIDAPEPWLLHLEFQANTDDWFVPRMLRYNTLLYCKHELVVSSVVFLLRQTANMVNVTGSWVMRPPVGPEWEYKYQVVRVWERPPDEFLTGPLALLPLAPIAATDRAGLPGIVDRMIDRIRSEADRPLADKLLTCTFLLMGLKYDSVLVRQLLGGVLQMEESTTYQFMLAQVEARWRTAEARTLILRQGCKRFGPPPASVSSALALITDLPRLEELSDRLLDASNWDELLPSP